MAITEAVGRDVEIHTGLQVLVPPDEIKKPTRRRIALGVLYVILGVATLWLALSGGLNGLLILPMVITFIVLEVKGLAAIGKGVWGPQWDLGFWLSSSWLVTILFLAVFADLLPLGEYKDTTKTLTEPGFIPPNLFSKHPLGTNGFGLDMLARAIYGARTTFLIVFVSISISLIVGGSIGVLAAYFRGWFESIVGFVTDAVMSMPGLLTLIAISAVIGPPKTVAEAAYKTGGVLALVSIPPMIRMSRAHTLAFKQREFVLASRAMGASHRRIIRLDILPNVALPVLSYSMLSIAGRMVAAGSLAFLGLGLQQPAPDWGNMIAESNFTILREFPFIVLVPGVFMFLTIFSVNRAGERLRSLWDPRPSKV